MSPSLAYIIIVLDLVRQQAEDSDLTHTRDLVLQSVLTFDPSGLHHVVTEVKNHLPSIGGEYCILDPGPWLLRSVCVCQERMPCNEP